MYVKLYVIVEPVSSQYRHDYLIFSYKTIFCCVSFSKFSTKKNDYFNRLT